MTEPTTEPLWSVEASHLDHAIEVVSRHARRTPLVPSPLLAEGAWLKLETEQLTGSFKVRGALSALAHLSPEARARGVLTASAGNHGFGLAAAGAALGVPVTVFVSAGAPAVKRAGIAAAGAKLEAIDAAGYDAVEEAAKAAASERGVTFVSPFDDPYVAAGNGGTIGVELLEDVPDLAAVIAPVGGGGLVAGLAAARRLRGADFQLIGAQSEACPAMVASLREGAPRLRFAGGPTLAEGLEGGVSATTFAIARRELQRMEAVPERDIADAMRFAADALGTTVEGSAAVALAWARAHLADLPRPFVVVLTGRNVDHTPAPGGAAG